MSGTVTDGLDLGASNRWFAGNLDGDPGTLTAELVQGGRSNLTHRLTDGRSTWVARRPPLGELTPSAHDTSREFRVVAGLHGTDGDAPGPPAAAGLAELDGGA